MQITKANINDLEAIVALNKLFHLDFPEFKWDTPEWVRKEIEDNNYYVARDKSVVASLCLKMKDKEAHIETIAVQQGMQGNGLGRELIEFAKVQSKQEGKSKLSVESFCDYGLVKFYEKCGFTKSPKLGNYKGHPYYTFSIII